MFVGKEKLDIENIITRAVAAGRLASERTAKDAFKATERRLYAVPVLRQKSQEDMERLAEIKQFGPQNKSSSITRFMKNGLRLSPEEIKEALIMDMEAGIAADKFELEIMDRALSHIAADEYYLTVTGRYLEGLSNEQIAERIPCELSTVWRNRKRLVQQLAVMLYGAAAVK